LTPICCCSPKSGGKSQDVKFTATSHNGSVDHLPP
jgi:hypothetical protein